MQPRTIEDLHDKKIGHRKFAKVCDLFAQNRIKVSDIKEYYEKFTFKILNKTYEYSKNWKASALSYVDYIINLLTMEELFYVTSKNNKK